jgi:transcriptional regulator of arginine metabolism
MNVKKQRLSAIENILRTEVIRNQTDLQRSLTDKGFQVTQATLSRDVSQLEIVKARDRQGHYRYTIPDRASHEPRPTPPPFDEATVEFSGSLAVIKTRPGYAMGIASDIDERASDVILGTIAGDDTILVIPREGFTRMQIKDELSKFLRK